jgi:hypothetical protein
MFIAKIDLDIAYHGHPRVRRNMESRDSADGPQPRTKVTRLSCYSALLTSLIRGSAVSVRLR